VQPNVRKICRSWVKQISFDCTGCFELDDKVVPMNQNDSIVFREMMDIQLIDQKKLTKIIKKTIEDNKNQIPEDVLVDFGFI